MDKLSAKDERIADLYALGYTAAQIADETGYGLTTVYTKLRGPLIKARVAEQRAAVLKPVRDRLVAELTNTAAVLAEIRDNADEPSRNRIAAGTELNAMFFRLEPMSEDAPLRAALEAQLQLAEDACDP